jgi:hypothetical protein
MPLATTDTAASSTPSSWVAPESKSFTVLQTGGYSVQAVMKQITGIAQDVLHATRHNAHCRQQHTQQLRSTRVQVIDSPASQQTSRDMQMSYASNPALGFCK